MLPGHDRLQPEATREQGVPPRRVLRRADREPQVALLLREQVRRVHEAQLGLVRVRVRVRVRDRDRS